MKIRLFENKNYDYLDLYLLIPSIELNTVTKDCIGENNYYSGIEANTKISYVHSSIGWNFTFIILGKQS